MRVKSSRPRASPRAFDARWVTGAGHLAVNGVPVPRAFANNNKNLLRNILSSFPTAQIVKGFKHCPILEKRRVFIDHKRPTKAIKPFALSLFNRSDSFHDLFMQFYWAETVTPCIKKWQLIFLYIGRIGLPGVCPGVCPPGGMLAAGIDSHITDKRRETVRLDFTYNSFKYVRVLKVNELNPLILFSERSLQKLKWKKRSFNSQNLHIIKLVLYFCCL